MLEIVANVLPHVPQPARNAPPDVPSQTYGAVRRTGHQNPTEERCQPVELAVIPVNEMRDRRIAPGWR